MKTFTLTIRTPETTVFEGPVQYAKFFTEQGLLKAFAGHSSVTGAIDFTPIIFKDDKNNKEEYILRRGTAMIDNNTNSIKIMAFNCEHKSEISKTTAEEYLKFIEAELRKGTDLSDFKINFYEEEKYVIEKQIASLKKK